MPEPQPIEEIWVNTTEAAEATDYNRIYLQKLANKFWNQPEEKRPIKVRNRSGRYELWLPDLIAYLDGPRRGPHPKRSPKE